MFQIRTSVVGRRPHNTVRREAPWRVLAPNRFACFPEPDFSLGLRVFAVCVLPSPPILLRLTLHRWRFGIFYFQPKRRAAPAIDRAEPLRHDALTPEPTSLTKNNRAILVV